jgi:hypothetical protein
VQISDLLPFADGAGKDELHVGINPGWEAYGGIIRDVWVDIRPAAFIQNVSLAYQLSPDYRQASCQAKVYLASAKAGNGRVEVVLKRGAAEVARASSTVSLQPGDHQAELKFEVKDPSLWSPEEPHLYDLVATLQNSGAGYEWSCRTGFREFKTEGSEFRLNGKKVILNGVCRHDMWKDQGFTLTRGQQEQDMRMIKALGCNFVRLVHYPHDRHIVELADELGLMVSEEPGYWQVNFETIPQSEIELGYHILDETIKRDWNSPSVIIWFLSNECRLTEETMRVGKERCRKIDPIARLVSVASDTNRKKSKPLFDGANMDFYDQHPYTYNVDDFTAEAEFDGPSKPLTFSEWGGKGIGQTEKVMKGSVDRLMEMAQAGTLAGHMFWSWQDMPEFSRIDAEMRDGILESGVVTEGREPRHLVWMELERLFQLRAHENVAYSEQPVVVPLRWAPWSKKNKFQAVDLQPLAEGPAGERAWANFEMSMRKYWSVREGWALDVSDDIPRGHWKESDGHFQLWQGNQIAVAGVGFQFPAVKGYVRPIVLTPESPEATIPVNLVCERVHILGQVTFGGGFPSAGKDGEVVGNYTLQFANGKKQEVPLRNGYEVVQANLVQSASRIDPLATESQRALVYVKDSVRERYQIQLLSLPAAGSKLASIRCQLRGDLPLAIFAVTAEQL